MVEWETLIEQQAGSRESRTLLQASSHFFRASRQRKFLLEGWRYVIGWDAIGWVIGWVFYVISNTFPCGSAGKESTCNAGDLGVIPVLG